ILWREFTELEIETLKFNNIHTPEDWQKHQTDAISWDEYFDQVFTFYIEMFQDLDDETGRPTKLPLTGWNNAEYDNIILKRYIGDIEPFDYHTRDIMHRFQIMKEGGLIKGLSLSKCHQELIGDIRDDEFHNSAIDCIAVKD